MYLSGMKYRMTVNMERATIANQLRNGTVQLNVLKEKLTKVRTSINRAKRRTNNGQDRGRSAGFHLWEQTGTTNECWTSGWAWAWTQCGDSSGPGFTHPSAEWHLSHLPEESLLHHACPQFQDQNSTQIPCFIPSLLHHKDRSSS